jgi:hypothetical protein
MGRQHRLLMSVMVPRVKDASTIQRDANLSTILAFELLSIDFHCCTMGEQQIMAHYPAFSGTITYCTLCAITSMPWGKKASAVSQN